MNTLTKEDRKRIMLSRAKDTIKELKEIQESELVTIVNNNKNTQEKE